MALQLFEDLAKFLPEASLCVDLMKENSFDEAINGCDYVFHVANPIETTIKDPLKDMFEPSLNGAKNVLNSCNKSKELKRLMN